MTLKEFLPRELLEEELTNEDEIVSCYMTIAELEIKDSILSENENLIET